jgi:hypothetical protein
MEQSNQAGVAPADLRPGERGGGSARRADAPRNSPGEALPFGNYACRAAFLNDVNAPVAYASATRRFRFDRILVKCSSAYPY